MAKRKKKLKTRTSKKKVAKVAKTAKRSSPKKTKRTAKKVVKKAVRKTKKKPVAKAPSPRRTAKKAMIERELEEGLIETFPASDPVALTDPTTTIKE
ncbi:hypothetical protein [Pseudolabrys sp. FHR47]|uniref:hypothetical protein n=1 Tax=Pseudolabrys sp. FHR47 TaxID=2562284 RepID=UPI0010BE666B|nr:hypothetical protein [Pseudolabrys sp. FHR47]